LGVQVELSGKVVLVTGSSRGIGREISLALAHKGARVAVHYCSDREAAHETLASLDGGPHALFSADVADADSARDLVESVVGEMGGIDVLINNAGIFKTHSIPDFLRRPAYDGARRARRRPRGGSSYGDASGLGYP